MKRLWNLPKVTQLVCEEPLVCLTYKPRLLTPHSFWTLSRYIQEIHFWEQCPLNTLVRDITILIHLNINKKRHSEPLFPLLLSGCFWAPRL